MPVAIQPQNTQDIVLYEEDDLGRFSRDIVTIASGRWLPIGTVLGKRSDGKCAALDPAATDGSQLFYGVLLADVDAFADKQAAAIVRHAIVKRQGLRWPAGLDAAAIQAFEDAAQTHGILVRDAI
ncbi:MAG: head decoration protein [Thiomonas sp.]